MPGLSVALGDTSDVGTAVADALDATDFLEDYVVRTPLTTDRVIVGETGYDGYPLRRVETECGTAVLEGRLYDVDDVEGHLERVASLVDAGDVEGVREWVGNRDGDFLLVVTDGDAVAVLNDAFGRLPTYHATVDDTVLVSRELRFVREFARRRGEPLDLDRLAVAQQLCFGYPLGDRTVFEGVRTVPPGSLLDVDDGVEIASVYDHDFERCRNAGVSLEANADALADRLVTACEDRSIPGRQSVVSLSGGLDSRTLAAAYVEAGLPATAATFQRSGGRNADEVATAGRVADVLGLEWSVAAVEQSDDRRSTLLETKQGMNYLGMGHLLDFLEQLREAYGAPVYVTGDGGDKVLVDVEPSRELESESALVEYAIGANSRMSPGEAAAVANVRERRLRESVGRRIRSYPESDLARKYVHFLVRERGINYLIHGEDRNRYFVWSVAPFYSLPVFEYAMNCPADQKRYRALHAAVLERFEPDLVDVTYPNYDAPITSRRYRAKQFVYDYLERYPGLRGTVVDLVTSESTDTRDVADAIHRRLPDLANSGLSRAAIAGVVADHESYSGTQLELLNTVTSLASSLQSDVSEGGPGPPESGGGVEVPTDD